MHLISWLALAPSFWFDSADWHSLDEPNGISWILTAYIHYKDGECERNISASLPFKILYSCSIQSLPQRYLLPSSGSNSTFLLFRPNVQLSLLLLTPLLTPHSNLHLRATLSNTDTSTQRIANVKVKMLQKITVGSGRGLRDFKQSCLLFNQAPPPHYEHPRGTELCFDVEMQEEIENRLASSRFARVSKLEPTPLYLAPIVPSTCFSTIDSNEIGAIVEYYLKFTVTIIDDCNGKIIELTASNPLAVSHTQEIEETTLSHETFLTITSSLLEDMAQCSFGLGVLENEWELVRGESSRGEKMVTFSSDHAAVLLDMLPSFHRQLSYFIVHLLDPTSNIREKVHWPTDAIPFNVFLLEIELMIRAGPDHTSPTEHVGKDPVVATILQTAHTYMTSARELVLSWARPLDRLDAKALCERLQTCEGRLVELLQVVADGFDTSLGVGEKLDGELYEAIRLSNLSLH